MFVEPDVRADAAHARGHVTTVQLLHLIPSISAVQLLQLHPGISAMQLLQLNPDISAVQLLHLNPAGHEQKDGERSAWFRHKQILI